MNNFKVGDRVVFINNKPIKTFDGKCYLGKKYKIGQIYNVVDISETKQKIKVESINGFLLSERFMLLTEYRKLKIKQLNG